MHAESVATPHPARPAAGRWRVGADGALRDTHATDAERVAAIAAHLWPLAIAFLGPLALLVPLAILVAAPRGRGFVADHAREAIQAQCTLAVLLLVPCAGWIALVPWTPVWLVAMVRASIAASAREHFRYPATLRPLRG
jgi:uncharacterized Tic20 family protein